MEIYKPFNKKQDENSKREKLIITLKNWKKNIWLLIFIGIFGFLILKEKISRKQVIFSITLFLGLIIAITQGSFISFDSNTISGVLILLLITCLWMFGHTVTKPIFIREEATPTQMVFLRNLLSGSILIFIYFLFFPISNLNLLLLFCWYKTLSYLDVSKATMLFSPTPLITAIFATLFLGENFTIFHLIGTIIVVISLIIIINHKS